MSALSRFLAWVRRPWTRRPTTAGRGGVLSLGPIESMPETVEPVDPFDPFGGLPIAAFRPLNETLGIGQHLMQSRGDSLSNVVSSLGTTLDKATQSRPDLLRRPLTSEECTALVRANGYARKIVESVPDLGTRKGWSVQVPGETSDPLAEEWQRLAAWQRVREAWALGRQHGGALLVPILDEDIPPAFKQAGRLASWLRQPLDWSRVRRVVRLVVYERDEFSAQEWDGDPTSQWYRQPRIWSLSPYNPGARTSTEPEIHASRVIFWPGAPTTARVRIQNSGFDDPILEAVFDAVRNKTVSEQAMGTLLHELKKNVLKVPGLTAKRASDGRDAFDAVLQRIAKSSSLLNLLVLDAGEEYSTQAQTVTGYADLDERAAVALAAVSGIPQTVLYGDSPGGLNADGESSRHTMAQFVSACQEATARERVEWLSRLLFRASEGPTKGQEPEGWALVFASLDEPTAKQTAELRKLNAETDATYIQNGVLDPVHVAASRFGPDGYGNDIQPLDGAALEDPAFSDLPPDDETGSVKPAGVTSAATGGEPASATALNGAQVQAAGDIVASVAEGRLPRESAVAMLIRFFSLTEQDAESIMGPVGRSFTIEPDAADPQAPLRGDAADPSALVWLALDPVSPERHEAAVTAARMVPGFEPAAGPLHITLLWAGPRTAREARILAEETARAVASLGEPWSPPAIDGTGLGAFPPDAQGRQAVFVEVWTAWLSRLREQVEAAIRERGVQLDGGWWFRPHVTLGYTTAELPGTLYEELEHAAAGRAVSYRVQSLEVRHGGKTLRTWPAR